MIRRTSQSPLPRARTQGRLQHGQFSSRASCSTPEPELRAACSTATQGRLQRDPQTIAVSGGGTALGGGNALYSNSVPLRSGSSQALQYSGSAKMPVAGAGSLTLPMPLQPGSLQAPILQEFVCLSNEHRGLRPGQSPDRRSSQEQREPKNTPCFSKTQSPERRERSSLDLVDERTSSLALKQQVAALEGAMNRMASRCTTLEQQVAEKFTNDARLFGDIEARLLSHSRELEKLLDRGGIVDAKMDSLGSRLAEQINTLGSDLTANLDGRGKEISENNSSADKEISAKSLLDDEDTVQKICDHVIARVHEDRRIFQVVNSQQALQESFSKLLKLLEKGSPPTGMSEKDNKMITQLHDMMIQTEKNSKSLSVEVRQMRQRRNQDCSDTTIRFDTLEDRFNNLHGKLEECFGLKLIAASNDDIVKTYGKIPTVATEQDRYQCKYDNSIDEETDSHPNN